MKETTRHLLHLAGLAALFYAFAFTARAIGITFAFVIFLPLGLIYECRFWWHLFRPKRGAPPTEAPQ